MKDSKKNPKYNKSDFMYFLATSTPEQLDKVIKEKGKEARYIPVIKWCK